MGREQGAPAPARSWLTACFTVFLTTQTLDRRRMSRHLTCTRTIARNTPNGSVKRSRRAGRSRPVRGGNCIQPDSINRGCWEHRTPSWRRRFELLSRALGAVGFLIIKAGSAYSGLLQLHTSCKGVQASSALWPFVSRRVLRQRMAEGRMYIHIPPSWDVGINLDHHILSLSFHC